MEELKPLVLEVKDLSDYRINETHLYAKDRNKELRLTFYGGMQVVVDGHKVYETNQPYEAVKFFNEFLPIVLPKKGDKIYIESQTYVYRGEDDIAGGLATIKEVEINEDLPIGHFNSIVVSIDGIPNKKFNWKYLNEKQEELAKIYKGKIAHPDPDHRAEFNDDDEGWH